MALTLWHNLVHNGIFLRDHFPTLGLTHLEQTRAFSESVSGPHRAVPSCQALTPAVLPPPLASGDMPSMLALTLVSH